MEREYQKEAGLESVGRVDGYDDFIFINRDGQVQHQGTLNKALRRIIRDCNDEVLEKYGIDSDPVLLPQFSCHILRHPYVKHTTKKYNSEKQKTQATKIVDLIAWGFCFCFVCYSKRSWTL